MKKPLILSLSFLCLIILPAEAAKRRGPSKEQQQEQKEKQAERERADKARDGVKEVLAAKDKNDDGTLTKEEYLTGEADAVAAAAKFDQFNKNGDRSLSKKEIEASLGF